MGLRFEGNREWNWQLRRMNERQLLAAAEFARQSEVLDRMVTTADRARVELDFTHRFPSPHDDIMHTATQPMGLDKAWVYGLIRQESRFVKSARSHVGASGLMQIMPATAKYVARKIGMAGFTLNNLNDTRTNITLGTQYLNMVLNNLGGSQTLATAAYNAGPGRPRLWRASLERPIEGAIFAETIPFSETRNYVKSVLANATWYAALFENKPQSLKARLGFVMPGDANLPELGDLP
jgi:soluble lytic murein transglycosylase